MKKGLVLGKFMPLHTGHLSLFDFASHHCDVLYVLLCHSNKEEISGSVREEWIKTSVAKIPNAIFISYLYDEDKLPNSSTSSKEISLQWSNAIKEILPEIDIIFTSEQYGDYIAEFLRIKHMVFDIDRKAIPISASLILNKPLLNWNFIADVAKPYFLKKVVLLGTESTGKSTLTKLLATYFKTNYVPEMAREILEKTEDCQPKHLIKIAELHAKEILTRTKNAVRLLFIDTDINITKSYSKYLFNEKLNTAAWVEEANKADLYIFLEPDCEFVQDGTRLPVLERNKLSLFHKDQLREMGIPYFSINGNWDERFEKAIVLIKEYFKL